MTTLSIREQAFKVLQDVLENIYEYVDNFTLYHYVDTDNGICAEFGMHYDSNTYVYFGCLFDDAEMTITIDNKQERFHLGLDEMEDILDSIN